MSRNRRHLVIVAVLGLSLLVAGCSSVLSDGGDSSDVDLDGMTAEELQTKAVNASQSVETAQFTQELTMDVDSQGSIEMETEGAMDLDAEKMRMEGEMSVEGQTIELTQYVVGDRTYVQTNGVWQQQPAQPNLWDEGQYVQQQEALESATDVEVVDRTTTNGHEVYVMDVGIDGDELLELVQQQGAQQGMGQIYQEMDISDVEATQHIDADSYQIRYMEMEMDISGAGEEMSISMTMTYDDINEPVDITLPEEARQADSNY